MFTSVIILHKKFTSKNWNKTITGENEGEEGFWRDFKSSRIFSQVCELVVCTSSNT